MQPTECQGPAPRCPHPYNRQTTHLGQTSTNEASAPAEPPPVTTDHGPRASDHLESVPEGTSPGERGASAPCPVSDGLPRQGADAPRSPFRDSLLPRIVLALLALLFSAVGTAALGTWVPARETAPRTFPDHRPRPEGHGDHNVTNEPNPEGGLEIIVAEFRPAATGTTGADRGPILRPQAVPLIPLRAPPRGTVTPATCRETGLPPGIAGLRVCSIRRS